MKNLTRSNILDAIQLIIENPTLLKGRQSSTYDLIYEGNTYPPILVLSEANKLAGGEDLNLWSFGNNTEKAFKILRDLGFIVALKEGLTFPNISEFIKVADLQQKGLGLNNEATLFSRKYNKKTKTIDIKSSFGTGRASAIPWIAFTGYGQTVTNGIYPVYLYFKEFQTLILAYGVSETQAPEKNWNASNDTTTIFEYFKKQKNKKPEKYGNSLVFKSYKTDELPDEEKLKADLSELLKEFEQLMGEKMEKSFFSKQVPFNVDYFHKSTEKSNLIFSKKLITRFCASLLTKRLLILTGLTGSGKTKIAQSFAEWICESEIQYKIIPVGADWTNREPLLGYPNGLENKKYVSPENGALELMINAHEKPALPFFMILDEMNLSHVERYFADFLSVMESDKNILLYSGEKRSNIPNELKWPENLFIIGTVNIDESTYMFSPKVLDRANVIEFRLNHNDLKNYFDEVKNSSNESLMAEGKEMAADFLKLSIKKSFNKNIEIQNILLAFFDQLSLVGAEFGYRTAKEIQILTENLKRLDSGLNPDDIIDIAIMQKLLPKLHGSRSKLIKVLDELLKLCAPDLIPEKLFSEDHNPSLKYKLSFEKIKRMYKNAIDNGFASYAEA